MNKVVKSIVILAVVAIAFGTAGVVLAQSATPEATVPGTGIGDGFGGHGARGQRGGMMGGNKEGAQDGLLHDEMIASFATELGLPVEDLETRLVEGESMVEIAISTGLTVDEFQALRVEVRTLVINKAVEDGTLTQEQDDWMKSRGAGMGNQTTRRGNGQNFLGTADCPYFQTNP
jgi:hypothetical protein